MTSKIEMLAITAGSAIVGTVTPFFAEISHIELPKIIIQLFQLLSYSTAIIVGCITIFKTLKQKK